MQFCHGSNHNTFEPIQASNHNTFRTYTGFKSQHFLNLYRLQYRFYKTEYTDTITAITYGPNYSTHCLVSLKKTAKSNDAYRATIIFRKTHFRTFFRSFELLGQPVEKRRFSRTPLMVLILAHIV